MNILFVWTGITGYTGDCWRALAALPGVRLKVLVEAPRSVADAAFDAAHELRGLDCTVVERDAPFDFGAIRDAVAAFAPETIFVVGWHAALPRFVATDPAFEGFRKVLAFDMPFAWTPRKLLAPLVLRRYLRRFRAVFVPGAEAARYARWLGFAPGTIRRGLFSTRLDRFAEAARRKLQCGVPRSFLYVGRYAPEKGLDTLAEAYGIYRRLVRDPWPLNCAGKGAARPTGEGISDLGFVPPDRLAEAYGANGVFVLPSRFEPWGVALAEACGSAMPTICSDAVGARRELLDGNGLVFRSGSARALAGAMARIHGLSGAALAGMAARSLELSRPYSSDEWAGRVAGFCRSFGDT